MSSTLFWTTNKIAQTKKPLSKQGPRPCDNSPRELFFIVFWMQSFMFLYCLSDLLIESLCIRVFTMSNGKQNPQAADPAIPPPINWAVAPRLYFSVYYQGFNIFLPNMLIRITLVLIRITLVLTDFFQINSFYVINLPLKKTHSKNGRLLSKLPKLRV